MITALYFLRYKDDESKVLEDEVAELYFFLYSFFKNETYLKFSSEWNNKEMGSKLFNLYFKTIKEVKAWLRKRNVAI